MSELYDRINELENKANVQKESLDINLEKLGYVLAKAKDGSMVAYGHEPQDRDYKCIFGTMGTLNLRKTWIHYLDLEDHGMSLPLMDSVQFRILDPIELFSAGNRQTSRKEERKLGFYPRTYCGGVDKCTLSNEDIVMVDNHIPSEMREKYGNFLLKRMDLLRSRISFF